MNLPGGQNARQPARARGGRVEWSFSPAPKRPRALWFGDHDRQGLRDARGDFVAGFELGDVDLRADLEGSRLALRAGDCDGALVGVDGVDLAGDLVRIDNEHAGLGAFGRQRDARGLGGADGRTTLAHRQRDLFRERRFHLVADLDLVEVDRLLAEVDLAGFALGGLEGDDALLLVDRLDGGGRGGNGAGAGGIGPDRPGGGLGIARLLDPQGDT